MPRLSTEQWTEARALYEAGASQSEIARRFGVARRAVQNAIARDGWKQDQEPEIRARVAHRIAERDPEKTAAAIDAEAERRAEVILRHRREWAALRERLEAAIAASRAAQTMEQRREAFELLKHAKIGAEALAIRQGAERRAWKLDDPGPDRGEPIEIVVTW